MTSCEAAKASKVRNSTLTPGYLKKPTHYYMRRKEVGGQAVLGRQLQTATPWLTERHGYDPT